MSHIVSSVYASRPGVKRTSTEVSTASNRPAARSVVGGMAVLESTVTTNAFAQRKDARVVAKAIEEDGRQKLLEKMREGYDAKSTRNTRDSYLIIWRRLHFLWCVDRQYFHITIEKLECAGALFKVAKYASFPSYLSRARQRHVELINEHSLEWSQFHVQTAQKVQPSVFRGMGPSKKSAPLEFMRIETCNGCKGSCGYDGHGQPKDSCNFRLLVHVARSRLQ